VQPCGRTQVLWKSFEIATREAEGLVEPFRMYVRLTDRRSAARHCAADASYAPIGVAKRYHGEPRPAVRVSCSALLGGGLQRLQVLP
jgi:hypothetical protein